MNFEQDFANIFGTKSDCTARDVTQITSLLKSHKYIQATPGSKSKGFTAKGLPPYLIPQTEEMKQRLRSEVWDPLTKIVHYVSVSNQLNERIFDERTNQAHSSTPFQ